jgi:hypothetical protein
MDRKGRKGPERTAFSETPNPELGEGEESLIATKYCGAFATELLLFIKNSDLLLRLRF